MLVLWDRIVIFPVKSGYEKKKVPWGFGHVGRSGLSGQYGKRDGWGQWGEAATGGTSCILLAEEPGVGG
jgi:hypothetical protein